ncbi:MAG: ATP-grasp domain-containing protein [Calditrichaeota bacterium]|nr:MAG: ATP-grasp domain-containing protein [Calditrichota bacterium]
MKIAVIGSGGREHTIAWKLAEQNPDSEIFVMPGNGGTPNNVPVTANDFAGIKQFCEDKGIQLIIVGPEDPLAGGIVDFFTGSAIRIFGPDKASARLEGSKIFAKKFMKKYKVATADFWLSDDAEGIESAIKRTDGHIVVKYDGLAAGKGVYVCSSQQQAREAIADIKQKYGTNAPFIAE